MTINAHSSFTMNDGLPAKLISRISLGPDRKIYPIHAELNPTNKCDLTCEFCGCRERDKSLELPIGEIRQILQLLQELGCRAITITGGGEPFMHPHINEIIDSAAVLNIKVGIMTNGRKIQLLAHAWPSWIRISYASTRNDGPGYFRAIEEAAKSWPGTDWSFSFILTRGGDLEKLKELAAFAADNGFGHIRVKPNTLDFDYCLPIDQIKEQMAGARGSNLILYQERKLRTSGSARCLIGLLIPNIGADGQIYPCCGVEYSYETPSLDYPLSTSLGNWRNLRQLIEGQKPFDGSACLRCYYNYYNTVLNAMTQNLKHRDFV